MAVRNCRFEVLLSKDEMYQLTRKARKAGMNKGAFVRQAIAEKEVKPAPNVEVLTLIQEIRNTETALESLVKDGVIDPTRTSAYVRDAEAAIKKVVNTYHRN